LIKELAGAHLCGPFFVVQRRRDFSRKDFLWNVECGMWNEKCWEARKEEGFFEEGFFEEGGRRNVHSIEKEIEEIRDRRRNKR